MNYWLFKSEPSEFGIEDLAHSAQQTSRWDGIRNYQARNFLRDQVRRHDQVFIYHSQCAEVGVAGLAEVVKAAYPDPAQFDPQSPYFDPKATADSPRWYAVDIRLVRQFQRILPLKIIKNDDRLTQMVLLKQGRLSVQPVSAEQAAVLLELADQGL